MAEKYEQQEIWALVELFGHQRIAGRVSEYSLGGNFIRVDVPGVGGRSPFTKVFGEKAIYAMTFLSRDVVLAMAERLDVKPVQAYDLASIEKDAVARRAAEAIVEGQPYRIADLSETVEPEDDDLPY